MTFPTSSVRSLGRSQRLYFRDALRDARAAAQRDSEGFQHIVHVLEWIGGYLRRENRGLGPAFQTISGIAAESPLASEIPSLLREFHTPFDVLFRQVKDGRNDAFHEGAIARHLAGDAVILALVLEDALMSKVRSVSDFMIRQPRSVELWQPLSFVRQIMLVNSFSYLPVNTSLSKEHRWQLVSDATVAKFTRRPSNAERTKRLRMSLRQAMTEGLELSDPTLCSPNTPVEEALAMYNGHPILVTASDDGRLLGFATPFDLL